MTALFRALATLVLCCAVSASAAPAASPANDGAPLRYRIVTADSSALTARIRTDLDKRLVRVFGGLRVPQNDGSRRRVVVAIGPTALRQAIAQPCECVVIGAFLSSQLWHSATRGVPRARLLSMTAIFAEPAPADQMQLISLLFPKKHPRVGALLSPETLYLQPLLTGVTDVQVYEQGADVMRVLGHMSQARVLLALPDQTVYTAENIRNVLLSTYRLNQAVIGFSVDMVKAGALASTFSDVEHINAHIADLAGEYLDTGELAAPQFPRYFSTIVNDGVARSLDVPIDAKVRRFSQQPLKRP